MKTISLIMPFRERIGLFEQMLKTMKETAKEPRKLELIVAVDEDDKMWLAKGEKILAENGWLDIRVLSCKRDEHMVNTYWNPMAKMARGRWVMDINDDSLFITSQWDIMIDFYMSLRARKIGDDVLYGKVDDCYTAGGRDSKNCYFSCWSVMGKEAIDALGFFYDPCIHVGGGDHVQGLIFTALRQITKENRIVEMYNIMIDHNSPSHGKGEPDHLLLRQHDIHRRNFFVTTREHEMEYAIKLKEYIERKRNEKKS